LRPWALSVTQRGTTEGRLPTTKDLYSYMSRLPVPTRPQAPAPMLTQLAPCNGHLFSRLIPSLTALLHLCTQFVSGRTQTEINTTNSSDLRPGRPRYEHCFLIKSLSRARAHVTRRPQDRCCPLLLEICLHRLPLHLRLRCVCVCVCVRACVRACVRVCGRAGEYTNINTNTHTHTHTRIQFVVSLPPSLYITPPPLPFSSHLPAPAEEAPCAPVQTQLSCVKFSYFYREHIL